MSTKTQFLNAANKAFPSHWAALKQVQSKYPRHAAENLLPDYTEFPVVTRLSIGERTTDGLVEGEKSHFPLVLTCRFADGRVAEYTGPLVFARGMKARFTGEPREYEVYANWFVNHLIVSDFGEAGLALGDWNKLPD